MNSNRLNFAALQVLLLLGGLPGPGCSRDPPPGETVVTARPFDSEVRSHFGNEVCRIAEESERVEVERLNARNGEGPIHPVLEPIGKPVVPSAGWAARLRAVLGDSRNYRYPKPCAPHPGVGVQFISGPDQATLLICFECDMFSLAKPGEFRWKSFDPARAELVKLAQEAFPRDPVIQALRDERGRP
jgi:hypothetical protein